MDWVNNLSLFISLVIPIDGWNIRNHYEFIFFEFIESGNYYCEITHYGSNRLATIFDNHITFGMKYTCYKLSVHHFAKDAIETLLIFGLKQTFLFMMKSSCFYYV